MKISRAVYSFDLYLFSIILSSFYNSAVSISSGPSRYSPIQRGYPPPPAPPPVKIHYGPKPPPTQIYVNKGPNEHLLFPPNRGSIIRSHLSAPSHGPPNHVLHSQPPPAQLSPHSFSLKAPLTSHLNHGPSLVHGHGINLHHVPVHHGPQSFNIPGPPQPPTPPLPPSPPPPPKAPQHFHNQVPPREFIVQHRPPSPSTISPIHSQKIQASSWKTGANAFKAPAVKESFHASPSSTFQSTSQFIRDDNDKGPIHTIPAPNLSLSDKNQHHIKQQIQQQHIKQIEEQQHLKQVQEQQNHLKLIQEQQNHLKRIQEQQNRLKHIQEQQHQLNQIQEQQHHLNQIQEQQHQLSQIHEQHTQIKHIQEQQPLNHFQDQHPQGQFHHQHHQKQQFHQQKQRIPQPSRPLHTDHTPVVTTHLKIDPQTTYRVMEDQTAHKPGEPSYFAPDPDPSIRPPKVPPTTDPFSFPSNGQLPLDLIVQQHNEKQAEQLQHLSSPEHSATMTAQDLFNIFNTINTQQQQLEVIPPSAVDQHLYESGGLSEQEIQHEPQNFNPQYETFNYDERTQQGAYGSDSYPVGSANYEYKRAVEKHTSFAKPNQQPSPIRMQPHQNAIHQNAIHQNAIHHQTMAKSNSVSFNVTPQKVSMSSGNSDVVHNQVDYEDQTGQDEREIVTTNTMKNSPVYTALPSRETAQTLAHLAASGMKTSTKTAYSSGDEATEEDEEGGEDEEEEDTRQKDSVAQNNNGVVNNNQQHKNENHQHSLSATSSTTLNGDGNVQVQKAIQIYQSSYFDKPNSHQHKVAKQEQEYEEEYSQEQDDDMEDGETQSSQAADDDSSSKSHTLSQSMSFGERLTPKRN